MVVLGGCSRGCRYGLEECGDGGTVLGEELDGLGVQLDREGEGAGATYSEAVGVAVVEGSAVVEEEAGGGDVLDGVEGRVAVAVGYVDIGTCGRDE